MDLRSCTVCQRNPGYFRREYEGKVLCKSCFRDSLERKVRRTISHWDMFSPDDHVAVAGPGARNGLTLPRFPPRPEMRSPPPVFTPSTLVTAIPATERKPVNLRPSTSNVLG